ncbi:MAG TPA: hypothetical protein VFO60_09905, partial [Candidatus Dormibacteraeota bacterium]|nr:hypothetical protein [Candidatus Dormibacteraeota bacterium]
PPPAAEERADPSPWAPPQRADADEPQAPPPPPIAAPWSPAAEARPFAPEPVAAPPLPSALREALIPPPPAIEPPAPVGPAPLAGAPAAPATAWGIRDRAANRAGAPSIPFPDVAPEPVPEPSQAPPPRPEESDRPRWNVRSSWLGAPPAEGGEAAATTEWIPAKEPAADVEPAAWPTASTATHATDEVRVAAPQAEIVAPGAWPATPAGPTWAPGAAWPSSAQPAEPPFSQPAVGHATGGTSSAPEADDMEARIRRAAETRADLDGDGAGPAWSVRRSPRQQALQQRMAQRRREDVIRAAAAAFDEGALASRRRDRLPPLDPSSLTGEVQELLRRKKAGEAAALVQRAAQEIGGREVADLAVECGDRCTDRKQNRAAINSYLAAWRADPLYEVPLWRLAEGCLSDRETELAVGYLERIADLMRARGDDEGAIDVYRKLISIAPERGDIRAVLQTAQSTGRFPD